MIDGKKNDVILTLPAFTKLYDEENGLFNAKVGTIFINKMMTYVQDTKKYATEIAAMDKEWMTDSVKMFQTLRYII